MNLHSLEPNRPYNEDDFLKFYLKTKTNDEYWTEYGKSLGKIALEYIPEEVTSEEDIREVFTKAISTLFVCGVVTRACKEDETALFNLLLLKAAIAEAESDRWSTDKPAESFGLGYFNVFIEKWPILKNM